jgi:hypothetical protein
MPAAWCGEGGKRAHGKAFGRVGIEACVHCNLQRAACVDRDLPGRVRWVDFCVALGLILILGALGRKVFSRWIGLLGALDLRLISTSSSSTYCSVVYSCLAVPSLLHRCLR